MTEWSVRHRGPGIIIYWHVEKKATCIYSQLKTVSSSEVAAMIEGVQRHCTDLAIERQYVDTHGQSEVAFGFCCLLNFELLPRLKGIHRQQLYRPEPGMLDAYPNLCLVFMRPIYWELIRQQYDEMVKYAIALRLGTTDAESILRRFTRGSGQHPDYQALWPPTERHPRLAVRGVESRVEVRSQSTQRTCCCSTTALRACSTTAR